MVEVNWAEVALRECDGVIDPPWGNRPGDLHAGEVTLGKSRWGSHPGETTLGKGMRRLRDLDYEKSAGRSPAHRSGLGAIGASHAAA